MKSKRKVTGLFLSLVLLCAAYPMPGAAAAAPPAGGNMISAADYGANGQDGLDDRAAIQAAVDAASAGDTVLIPKGTYQLSGTVTGKSDVSIRGEKRDKTIVQFTSAADTYMFYLHNVTNASVSDLTLDASGSQIAMSAVVSEGGSKNKMRNLRVQNFIATEGFGPHALYVVGSTHVSISDNIVANIGIASIWGAAVRAGWGSSDVLVENNVISNTGRGGILINDDSPGAIVRSNKITGSGLKEHGLSIELHTNVDNSIIEDNVVDFWISAVRSDTVAVRNNIVKPADGRVGSIGLEVMADNAVTTDNIVDGGQQVGIQQSPGTGYQLWGYNVVKNMVMWGMQLQGEGTGQIEQFQYFYRNSFINTQEGNPAAAYPGYDGNGVRIHGSSQNLTFDSNLIAGNGRKGIEFTGAAGVDRLSFTNNIITGNKGVAVDPYPASAGHLEWKGNTVLRNGSNAQPSSRGFSNPKPTADFEAPAIVRVGEPVTFVNKSKDNGSISHQLWDFGAGLPSASVKPTYVYDRLGAYRVTLVVWDNEGRSSLKERLVLVRPGKPDTQAPSAPSGLVSPLQTDESIALSWNPAEDNVGVVSYDVFVDGTLAGSTAPGETSYLVTGLSPLTTYGITLRAKDAAGNVSAPSASLRVATEAPDAEPPGKPAGMTAAVSGATTASLTWSASTDNKGVTGYEVFRGGILIGTTSGTAYEATGLLPGTPNTFTVKAKDAAGNRSEASDPATAVQSAPEADVYLSDYAWDSGSAGWGSIMRDKSSDGRPITLNGVEYAKGLGTHAASEIVYTVGGAYSRFLAVVGVDDETYGNGAVSFEVWLDGVLAYDSGVMTADSETASIDLDIGGAQVLKLVVTNGGNGTDWDHADWGNARIVYGSGE
ncbi:NPCBM/NEW2 domain-containing protein [Paenibacillus glycanilyticus]|uniref:NPCBM/NEW2 domain-containing protein n=1 Tax=Paenibacillus glycanilyticus TaxID=126569 RepID=UPI00204149ED|nr:NPCBM/NEW2 domain-containing protein [Paenibacillus glycanilyticus]MCM3628291.1 NPCBM/NEW2 domain-containing protein [Paenibacillus glycanilyticus]